MLRSPVMSRFVSASGLSGVGFLVLGVAVPLALPKQVPDVVQYALLAIGMLLVMLAWALGTRSARVREGSHPAQSTTGPQSPSIGTNYGTVHIGPPAPAVTQPIKQPFVGPRLQSRGESSFHSQLDRYAKLGRPPLTRPVMPDLPLKGVLVRLYKKLGPPPMDQQDWVRFVRRINLAIADGVSQHGLLVWGRLGETPLRPISLMIWNHGMVLHQEDVFQFRHPDNPRADRYTDLTFNKAEIDQIWP